MDDNMRYVVTKYRVYYWDNLMDSIHKWYEFVEKVKHDISKGVLNTFEILVNLTTFTFFSDKNPNICTFNDFFHIITLLMMI